MKKFPLALAVLFFAWGQPSLAQDGASDPVPLGDRGMWVQAADWPRDLYQRGIEGSVRARLIISAAGRVTNCAILNSSGFEAMDLIACTRLRQRGQFEPARNVNGEATDGVYDTTVVFKFNERRIPAERTSRRIMTIEKDGTVSDCSIEIFKPDVPVELRACQEGPPYAPLLNANGEPVRVKVTSERIESREILAE